MSVASLHRVPFPGDRADHLSFDLPFRVAGSVLGLLHGRGWAMCPFDQVPTGDFSLLEGCVFSTELLCSLTRDDICELPPDLLFRGDDLVSRPVPHFSGSVFRYAVVAPRSVEWKIVSQQAWATASATVCGPANGGLIAAWPEVVRELDGAMFVGTGIVRSLNYVSDPCMYTCVVFFLSPRGVLFGIGIDDINALLRIVGFNDEGRARQVMWDGGFGTEKNAFYPVGIGPEVIDPVRRTCSSTGKGTRAT